MSTESSSAVAAQKRKGLRVAFAVSIGFTVAVYAGAIVPFLAPLFAAQFLLGSSRPMPLGKTIGAVMVILIAGMAMMVLTNVLGDRPAPFLLILGLTYFVASPRSRQEREGRRSFSCSSFRSSCRCSAS